MLRRLGDHFTIEADILAIGAAAAPADNRWSAVALAG
jgi:hypothetical protein